MTTLRLHCTPGSRHSDTLVGRIDLITEKSDRDTSDNYPSETLAVATNINLPIQLHSEEFEEPEFCSTKFKFG